MDNLIFIIIFFVISAIINLFIKKRTEKNETNENGKYEEFLKEFFEDTDEEKEYQNYSKGEGEEVIATQQITSNYEYDSQKTENENKSKTALPEENFSTYNYEITNKKLEKGIENYHKGNNLLKEKNLKNAVIWKEILDKPKALRNFEETF